MAVQNTPYTDLYTLNLDWVMRAVMNLQKAWAGFQVEWGKDIAAQVDAWLSAHPEATTTVLDGSIDTVKFVSGLRQLAELYVTPQKYGAVGDGVTDDKKAFLEAISSGKPVIVPEASYYMNEDIFTDDSIVVKDLGSYTGHKLFVSRKISKAPLSVVSRIRIPMTGLIGSTAISGCCINGNTGKLIVAGYEDSYIYQINPNTGAIEAAGTVSQLGHANTLTFYPAANKYYATPAQSIGTIIELNTDLTFSQTIVLPSMSIIPWRFVYDADHDVFFAGNDQWTYVYDSTMTTVLKVIEHYPNTLMNSTYDNVRDTLSQGSCVYEGQMIFGVWIQGLLSTPTYAPCYARLGIFNWEDLTVKGCWDIPLLVNEEFEDMDVLNDELIMVSNAVGTSQNDLIITRLNVKDVYISPVETYPIEEAGADYTANSYCTSADTDRILSMRKGDVGLIDFNLRLAAAIPANTLNVQIGVLPYRLVRSVNLTVPNDAGDGTLYVNLAVSGEITISNYNAVSLQGFFRASVPVFCR